MDTFVQLTINGLSNGAILALAALGFVLIFKATGVINFAQGEFLLIGAFVIWFAMVEVGLPWPAAIGVAICVAIALGMLVERTILRPLVGQPVISVIMVTIGLAAVLQSLVQILWGTRPRPFPDFISGGSVELLGTTVAANRLWAIGIVAVAIVAFSIFYTRSREGVAMRAVADDQQAALAQGISVRRTFALAWVLAGVTAVFGGALVANLIGVSGNISAFGLLVFPVVIVGGLDSVPGAVLGGAIIGLLASYTGGYVGGGLETVIPYVALLGILLVKPYGLFGEVRIERV
ncbi:MAG TPA: branched-chain amino acid ABC transporter permease [Solirubrobacteraceae bacterium]|nr:branched-chain amino acid ABC transporter permease [Solirubrobacteraceae bacterium]